jgi:hypothetical protein
MSRLRTATDPRDAAEEVPDCIVRNHDADREYDLVVTVREGEEVVLERAVVLDPEATVAWADAVPPGRYEVHAEVTGGSEAPASVASTRRPGGRRSSRSATGTSASPRASRPPRRVAPEPGAPRREFHAPRVSPRCRVSPGHAFVVC